LWIILKYCINANWTFINRNEEKIKFKKENSILEKYILCSSYITNTRARLTFKKTEKYYKKQLNAKFNSTCKQSLTIQINMLIISLSRILVKKPKDFF